MTVRLRFAIAVLIVVIDQITKQLAEHSLSLYQQVVINPVFNITLHHNPGAAFSFLSDAGGWQRYFLTGISLVVSLVLIVWLYRLPKADRLNGWALSLILGGAVGNLIDRALFGKVIDFIQVHYQDWYFPTFNIADSAISVGGALLLLGLFFPPAAERADKTTEHQEP